MQSHPEWVRGLKHIEQGVLNTEEVSHPEWVRGLKLLQIKAYLEKEKSHPEWVRGLKQNLQIQVI